MNINHLALFHAVAEEGSFSRGADRLFISQPAVSKQIAEFEETLGMRLFERIPRGVRLTEAGSLLLGYSRRLFKIEAEAEYALQELQGLERGKLAVGASTTIGVYLLPEVFGFFHKLHPKLELQLEIGNTDIIQTLVLEGTVDIGLTEGPQIQSDLIDTPFMEDELVAIAPPDHKIFQEREITAARFCEEPIVLREKGSGTRMVLERAFEEKGLLLTPIMSLGSTEAIKRAVAGGVGLAVVSRLTLDLELEMERLKVAPLADLSLHRPLHTLNRRGFQESRGVAAFMNLLRSHIGGKKWLGSDIKKKKS